MPITNDSESRSHDSQDGSVLEEALSAEPVGGSAEPSIITGPGDNVCGVCGSSLFPFGYRGLYGWSHPKEASDVKEICRFSEGWDRWSLYWAGKLTPRHDCVGRYDQPNVPNPAVSLGDTTILLRQSGVIKPTDIPGIEAAIGKMVWLWEAASKSIVLNSDGYLRVNGKGSIISMPTMPVILDFGPGFITRDGFVSKVAHVLETREKNGNLYIKFRWLTHDEFVKELTECPDKYLPSKASSPA